MATFTRSVALIVGINKYELSVSQLKTAAPDARRLAEILDKQHGYEIDLIVDEDATQSAILNAIQYWQTGLTSRDRFLFYFAGHGLANESEGANPEGYLLPCDANRDGNTTRFISLRDLTQRFTDFACRHFLLILDCCFAGTVRWATAATRQAAIGSSNSHFLYEQTYQRFVRGSAWQIITSSGAQQLATDLRYGKREHLNEHQLHSPFALALFEVLEGRNTPNNATFDDWAANNVITATRLYDTLRTSLERFSSVSIPTQTPQLFVFPTRHDRGEYVFVRPGVREEELHLRSARELTEDDNPYRGLTAYDEQTTNLFFGRDRLAAELHDRVAKSPLTVITGESGSGKSSLMQAGLLGKYLRIEETQGLITVLGPVQPGQHPRINLEQALGGQTLNAWVKLAKQQSNESITKRVVLMIDQFEELLTTDASEEGGDVLAELAEILTQFPNHLRLVVTVRSDIASRFSESPLGTLWAAPDSHFVVPPMSSTELREVIVRSAERVPVFFESESLVTRIIAEARRVPLALFSFALSELYMRMLADPDARANFEIRETHYKQLGGVEGALGARADQLMRQTGDPGMMRRVMLRLVTQEGNQTVRRHVNLDEFIYVEHADSQRASKVIKLLQTYRLITPSGSDKLGGAVVIAHDALIEGWSTFRTWIANSSEMLRLRPRLTTDASLWAAHQEVTKQSTLIRRIQGLTNQGLLWVNDPDLPSVEHALNSGEQNWLNAQETAFVQESLMQSRFNQRVIPSTFALITMVLSALTILSFFQSVSANDQRQAAQVSASTAIAASTRAVAQQATAETASEQAISQSATAEVANRLANQNLNLAEKRLQQSRSQTLAAQSRALAQTSASLSLLLSIEAVRTYTTSQALSSLLSNLADRSEYITSVERGDSRGGSVSDSCSSTSLSLIAMYLYKDNAVELWNIAQPDKPTRTTIVTLPHNALGFSTITNVSLSSDCQIMAIATAEGTSPKNETTNIQLWDISPGGDAKIRTQVLKLKRTVWGNAAMEFSHGKQLLAVIDQSGDLTLYDLANINPPRLLANLRKEAESTSTDFLTAHCRFTEDDRRLIVVAASRIFLFDLDINVKTPLVTKTDFVGVSDLQMIPNSSYFATLGNRLRFWDLSNWTSIRETNYQLPGYLTAEALAFSADGKRIAVGTKKLAVWDISSLAEPILLSSPLEGHRDTIEQIEFVNDSTLASFDRYNGQWILWDISKSQRPLLLDVFSINVDIDDRGPIAFSPDGALFVEDKKGLTIWSVVSNTSPISKTTIATRDNLVRGVSFDLKRGLVAIVSGWYTTSVDLWDIRVIEKPQLLSRFGWQNANNFREIEFIPQSSLLVVSTGSGAQVWDTTNPQSPKATQVLDAQQLGTATEITLSSVARLLVIANSDKSIAIWRYSSDGNEWRLMQKLEKLESDISALSLNPQGTMLAVAFLQSNPIYIFDLTKVDEPYLLQTLTDHSRRAIDLSFNRDGTLLASTDETSEVRLWFVDNSNKLTLLDGFTSISQRRQLVAFNPSQDLLAISNPYEISLWSASPRDWLRIACEKVRRNMTRNEWSQYMESEPYRATCTNYSVESSGSS